MYRKRRGVTYIHTYMYIYTRSYIYTYIVIYIYISYNMKDPIGSMRNIKNYLY